MPPEVITWADPAALAQFRDDLAALRSQADVVIASHHWGLDHEVLDYQVEIAQSGWRWTNYVASRHALGQRSRSRATKSWCGASHSTTV